jgi:hypothetical protein
MATSTTLDRQPTKLDYVSPTQFKFLINQLPKVEYFTVSVNLPAISLGEATVQTPYREIPLMGDTLTYDNLTVTFIVDEYLENYRSLHDWMTALGFPKSRSQFSKFRAEESITTVPTRGTAYVDTGKASQPTSTRGMYSDITVTILSNKNNPIIEVRFEDAFPTSLTSLDFTQTATDVEYLTASADFSYKLYEIVAL